MPRRKLPTPPRLSNTGYVAVYKSHLNDQKNDDKLLISKRLTGELQDKYSACDDWQLSVCPLCRPERRSPQWTQSSTPRGFTISSPLSCHSLQVWQGAQRHVGKEGQVGSRAGEEMWRREKKNHQEAELLRCCDGFVSLSLIRSPSSSLHLSLSLPVGCHALQLKKKKTSPVYI